MNNKRKIKVAFYREGRHSTSLFSRLIKFQQYRLQNLPWSSAKYSHAEIVFCDLKEDEKELLIKNDFQYRKKEVIKNNKKIIIKKENFINAFFSSSPVDGGVRFKDIKPNKNHWDFIEIEVSNEQYKKGLEKGIELNGSKYGWSGIFFAQALRINWAFSKSFFCSQVSTIVLTEMFSNNFGKSFYSKYSYFLNPAKLHKRLLNFLETK